MTENHKDLKILVVEDSYLVSEMILRSLKELGFHNIIEAHDGKDGVLQCCIHNPDIILMDIEMPKMNGIEATRIIQNEHPTPIIILTAFEQQSVIEEATAAGAMSYLVKPLNSYLIERVITTSIARHKDWLTMKNLSDELAVKNSKLEKALAEIKTLRGIIPICAHCKKIRDDQGFWNDVTSYLTQHTNAELSHGICNDCAKELYGEQEWFQSINDKIEPAGDEPT